MVASFQRRLLFRADGTIPCVHPHQMGESQLRLHVCGIAGIVCQAVVHLADKGPVVLFAEIRHQVVADRLAVQGDAAVQRIGLLLRGIFPQNRRIDGHRFKIRQTVISGSQHKTHPQVQFITVHLTECQRIGSRYRILLRIHCPGVVFRRFRPGRFRLQLYRLRILGQLLAFQRRFGQMVDIGKHISQNRQFLCPRRVNAVKPHQQYRTSRHAGQCLAPNRPFPSAPGTSGMCLHFFCSMQNRPGQRLHLLLCQRYIVHRQIIQAVHEITIFTHG